MNRDLTCLTDPENGERLVSSADAVRSSHGRPYPIVRGIPRFVATENYADDFGAQWNMFPETQLDSFTELHHSETRLARCLRGSLPHLRDKKVLEAGSGAGRFTEVLLRYGALVHSFDYSNAVEANAKNNGHHERLVLAQADIRRMPFPEAAYDYVICLGVLQHTPDPEESVKCLWKMVRPGGALVVDHYLWKWRNVLRAETAYRQLILRLPKRMRFKFVKIVTDAWFPLHWRLRDSVFLQRILARVSPVRFYYPHYRLRDRGMYYDLALLDTHDATTDHYKHYRTPSQIRQLLEGLGGEDVQVEVGGNGVEGSCRKPVWREQAAF